MSERILSFKDLRVYKLAFESQQRFLKFPKLFRRENDTR